MKKISSDEVGFRLARIDEDFYLDRFAEDASTKDYTTTIYQVPSMQTEDEIIGISDNKGYLKLFNIQQNDYAIYKLFVESEGDVIPLNTPWKHFKFISNNQLSTPRTYKSRVLFENEDDEPPCYHECPAYKICFLQQNSNKMFYSIVHFGKTYYENDSLYARSTHVFGCAQHQDQITCFDIENNYLVTGSINGDIKVWIHREESIEMNQDESFELFWTLKAAHKKQFLQRVAIVIPTSGYSKNPFIVSGGGPDGTLLIHDIENQQLLQQIILESSPFSLMREFMPSSALIACNQLGTVYLYEESEDIYSQTILNLQIAYYIISDQPNITVNSVTCFFMNNDMVNVFSVTFRDKNNKIVSNSIQFYIGQLLVMEYSFETPILFCTVFCMKKDTRINVKSSIPLPGSHLVACDKDGRGNVWLIDEIISQILKKDQQESQFDDYQHEQLEEEPIQNTSFSLETPRPHSVPKQMQSYYSPNEEEKVHEEEHTNIVGYSSEEDILSDVTSVMSSLSSISLQPREMKSVPKPTRNPSTNNMDPTIPQTMDQMFWSQEFPSNKPQDDRIDMDLDEIDRNRDILTPEPQVIKIRKTVSPPKQSSPVLKTHSLPEFTNIESSPALEDEDFNETTPQMNEIVPKPIIRKEPKAKEAPKSVIIDDTSPVTNNSKPLRKRIKPETTRVNSASNLQVEVLVPKKPNSSLKKSASSGEVKIVNHFTESAPNSQNTEPEYNIPEHTPAITPNSSRRIEHKLYQKQAEEFNEQAARQVLRENSLFNKNDAEKVLNYTPGESMFGNLPILENQDLDKKNYDVVETKLKKQVSKKHLKEIKQRPSIMDLYVKEDWEKEITLEQTGPRIIYSLSFDQFGDVEPHPKGEYDSIRKFLKENPII